MKKINSRTEKVEIRLSPEEKEELKEYCRLNEYTMSDFIREAITTLLKLLEQ